jgi:hypothetical protein
VVGWDGVVIDVDGEVDVPTVIGAGLDGPRPTAATHVWIYSGDPVSSFYSDEALTDQLQFFERHLRDRPVPELPPTTDLTQS